jgi:hypothetical protein
MSCNAHADSRCFLNLTVDVTIHQRALSVNHGVLSLYTGSRLVIAVAGKWCGVHLHSEPGRSASDILTAFVDLGSHIC